MNAYQTYNDACFTGETTIEDELRTRMNSQSPAGMGSTYAAYDTRPEYKGPASKDPFQSQSTVHTKYDVERDQHVEQLMPQGWEDTRSDREQKLKQDPRNDALMLAPTKEDIDSAFEMQGIAQRSQVAGNVGHSSRFGMQSFANPLFDDAMKQSSEAQQAIQQAEDAFQEQARGRDDEDEMEFMSVGGGGSISWSRGY
jgi:hypothetical protein